MYLCLYVFIGVIMDSFGPMSMAYIVFLCQIVLLLDYILVHVLGTYVYRRKTDINNYESVRIENNIDDTSVYNDKSEEYSLVKSA